MRTTPISNLLAAHRAVLEDTQEMGLKSVEIATRFFELNTQATQGMLASGSQTAHGGPPDATAMARGAAEYTQRALSLVWQSQTEVTELFNRQASHLQALLNELLSAAVQMQQSSLQTHAPEPHRRSHSARAAASEPV